MKIKIPVIFTGGTICTTVTNHTMNTSDEATAALIDMYRNSDSEYVGDVEFTHCKRFDILSENMTTDKWNELIEYFISDVLPCTNRYSGIIIAHGTDTLAYSAALFSVLLQNITVPVFFVSGNRPILCENGEPNHESNGCDNFRAAVECICRNIAADVYVTYKNPEDNKMYLHKGSELVQCKIYDDNFYSENALDISFGVDFEKSDSGRSNGEDTEMPIYNFVHKKLKDCILKITPYPGINYDMFDLRTVKAVLHGTYHSGTACVVRTDKYSAFFPDKDSILYLFDKCAKLNIPFYFSPSQSGESHTVYDSVVHIENYETDGQKIRFCYGDTDELMYAKLIIKYSLQPSPQNE